MEEHREGEEDLYKQNIRYKLADGPEHNGSLNE